MYIMLNVLATSETFKLTFVSIALKELMKPSPFKN
jgi:hypothetical protein